MEDLNSSFAIFMEELHSTASVPGSGAPSALVGAIGAGLGGMVGKLTAGKGKHTGSDAYIKGIVKEAEKVEKRLLEKLEGEIRMTELLSKACGISEDKPNRAELIESVLQIACTVPMAVMRDCCKAIEQQAALARTNSVTALGDLGAGVIFLKSALMASGINVFNHTKAMIDRKYAALIQAEADEMLLRYCALAEDTYASIIKRLRENN